MSENVLLPQLFETRSKVPLQKRKYPDRRSTGDAEITGRAAAALQRGTKSPLGTPFSEKMSWCCCCLTLASGCLAIFSKQSHELLNSRFEVELGHWGTLDLRGFELILTFACLTWPIRE